MEEEIKMPNWVKNKLLNKEKIKQELKMLPSLIMICLMFTYAGYIRGSYDVCERMNMIGGIEHTGNFIKDQFNYKCDDNPLFLKTDFIPLYNVSELNNEQRNNTWNT